MVTELCGPLAGCQWEGFSHCGLQKPICNACGAARLYRRCQDFDVLDLNMGDFESFAAELDRPGKTGLKF